MFVVSAAWLPWLAWALARRRWAALAIAFAMALLGGGWSMLVYAAPVVLFFAIARAERVALRETIGATLLGAAIAAIQLLPALAHTELSPRALPLAPSFAHSYAWPSLKYAVTLVFPLWLGDDARGTYIGAPDQWELCGYGCGLVVALLAASSLRATKNAIVYAAAIGLAMIAACGVLELPILDRLRCPARALFLYTLIVPVAAAYGVDRLRARWRRTRHVSGWLAPVLVALELVVTFRAENPTVTIAEAHATPAVVAQIPTTPTEDRTLIDVHLGQAFHNGGARWNLETATGYSSVPLWRLLHLLWIANHGRTYPGWPHPQLAHDLSAQNLWTYGSPLVDLLGVRWALVPRDRVADASGWHLVKIGADGIDLGRNDEALPRAFVLHRAEVVADEAAAAEAIADRAFDPSRTAIVEVANAVSGDAPFTVATIVERTLDRIRVRAAGGILVVTEPFEPSWGATLDGNAIAVQRVDYALLGVAVPDGEHEVVLTRHDRALRIGALITLGALLLLAALGWRMRDRRLRVAR